MALDDEPISFEQRKNPSKGVWGARRAGFGRPHPAVVADDPRFANVRAPGQAMLNAGHGRGPVHGAHNWIPRGPRNVGGRVRALAIHPHFDNILFAGSGLGGLWKSDNAGETWFPLWHDEPSLSIAGIAIHHQLGDPVEDTTVWVATGELVQNPVDFTVDGAGVFRSTDNGVNFAPVATVAQLGGTARWEAIAVHPTDRTHAWVVGLTGAFRIVAPIGGGAPVIDHFDAGVAYSDVAFAAAAPDAPLPVGVRPHPFCLYLARRRTIAGDIVRIDDPTAAIAPAVFAAASPAIAQPIPPGGTPIIPAPVGAAAVPAGTQMGRAKFAICRDTPSVMFVVYANAQGAGGFGGVFRTQAANLRPGFNAAVWQWLPIDTAIDLLAQGQGLYDLAIGVSPVDPEHLFVGFVELFLSRDANHPIAVGGLAGVTWQKCVDGHRFSVDRSTHPDHHAVVFEQQANPPSVFTANDGGVFRNRDYHAAGTTFPPFMLTIVAGALVRTFPQYPMDPEPTHRWERRHFGLHGSQPFDVASSPISPNLYGCGFVDNGSWFSAGGDTWRFAGTGDGSFISFDAHDPYQFVVTWQAIIEAARFAGANQDVVPPTGTAVLEHTPNRGLSRGFFDADPPRFAGDTLMHPTRPFQILTLRHGRAYRSTDGEEFHHLNAGCGVEIILSRQNISGNLEIYGMGIEMQRTAGAVKLGMLDSQIDLLIVNDTNTGHVRCATGTPGPWNLSDGDTLSFTMLRWTLSVPAAAPVVPGPVIRRAVQVTFRRGPAFADLSRVTAAELAAAIDAAITAAGIITATRVLPVFYNAPQAIELRTPGVAPASIELRGTAAPALGVTAGVYQAEPGRHASLTLQTVTINEALRSQVIPQDLRRVDLTGLDLRVGINGGATVPVDLTDASLGARNAPSSALLARAIEAALPALDVAPVMMRKRCTLLSDVTVFGVLGTALDALGIAGLAGAPMSVLPLLPGFLTHADLSPIGGVDRRLSVAVAGGGGPTHIDFTAAAVVDQARVTPEEICTHVNAALVAAGILPATLRCVVSATPVTGDPSELAFAPSSMNHLWVGGSDGHVLRSTDDGVTWRDVTDRLMLFQDRAVEAIAVHPTNADRVYVGLSGRGIAHANDAGMLFTTFNGGDIWVPIGATIRATDGTLLPIHAIEIDPEHPRHVYVATPAGVWFSDDEGGTFVELSQGLPNVVIMDLELERTSRTLRVALWGRGVWERHIGTQPPRDQRVFLRSSVQDQGFRPVVEGLDPGAFTPVSTTMFTSPDIKNSPDRPDVGATDAEIDGVEFDELIAHEEPFEGASNLFVQVHNHGSFPATNVRVTALWAEHACGPPPLTTEFFESVRAGAPVAPARWTLAATQLLPGELVVGTPRVVALPVVWPASVGDLGEIAIVAVVTSAEDQLSAATAIDTAAAVRTEPKVALRLTETRRLADAREIHLVATDPGGFSITGGTVAATLGFATGPAVLRFARSAGGADGVFDLSAVPAPRTLVLTAAAGGAVATVRFGAPDIPDPVHATAAQLRRAINRELVLRNFPARAIVGNTDFSVATSVTDEGRRPLQLPSASLADLVVRDAAVPEPDRAALFDLIPRITSVDRIRPNLDNHFHLRVTNRGSADLDGVRCRLYRLAFPVAAAPAHVAEQVHPAAVPARDARVVDVVWNPGALAGPFAVILVTVDHATRGSIALPAAGFADLEAVRSFCRTTNNAAYRVIPVS